MTGSGTFRTPQLHLFEENIEYARKLITGGTALKGIQRISGADYGDLAQAHPEDLFRAAWSQAVAALDHWLHEEVIERAVKLANDTGRQRPDSLARLKMPIEMVERTYREPFYVIFREFLEIEYRRTSFHSTEDITSGVRLVTHLKPGEIWTAVGKAFGMTPVEVKQRHDREIIKRRNDIAHRADRDAQGRRQPLSAAEAGAAVAWIHDLVHELAVLLG